MSLSRRTFIGAALGGGALATFGGVHAWALGNTAKAAAERLVLVAPEADPEFAAAAAQGAPVVVVRGAAGLAEAAGWMAAQPGRRLVGLLDEADGTVLRHLVPAGSPWLALGHHREAGGHSRHLFNDLPASAGLDRYLAAHGEHWQAALGDALGRIALGRWRPAGGPDAPAGSHGASRDVALTSFVVG